MRIASGCSLQSTVAQEASRSSRAWLSRNLTLKLVLVCRRKVRRLLRKICRAPRRREANDAVVSQQSADGWLPTRAARQVLGLRAGDRRWAHVSVALTEATTASNARLTPSASRLPFQASASSSQMECPCSPQASSYQAPRLLNRQLRAILVNALFGPLTDFF